MSCRAADKSWLTSGAGKRKTRHPAAASALSVSL
jgi:hypothetical protein